MSNSELDRQWQKHFDQWLQPFWASATPGLCFQVYQGGQLLASYQGGEVFPFYDLASLTKVLFTVPGLMLAMHQGLWSPESTVKTILPWWPHSQTKIIELLTHSSGLIWWKPFYQDLVNEPVVSKRWELLRTEIQNSVLVPSAKAVYSDVGFLSLAFLLKSFWSLSLEATWEKVKAEFAGQSSLHWIRPGQAPHLKSDYAPTEECAWRGRRLQAEVHDENAWVLGGLSSHAGLFGNCSDVAEVFLTIRAAFFDGRHPLHNTVRYFMKRQMPSERGDWALGFVLPSPGNSTSGQFFSPSSIGHTGFTGTSVWWDPEKDVMIVILSNRVFYGREKREFAKLRPLLHDEIISLLRRNERT
jgi:CubicO group peptidase (beta-lactamase class C family)